MESLFLKYVLQLPIHENILSIFEFEDSILEISTKNYANSDNY